MYPAAALKVWGFDYRQYKREQGARVRADIVEKVKTRVDGWLEVPPAEWDRFRSNDDAFDAFIASLVARAHALGLCVAIPYGFSEAADREGWIALPEPDALEHLAMAD